MRSAQDSTSSRTWSAYPLATTGVPGEQISYQLGHRRPGDRTTRGYGAYEPEFLEEAARALDAWINGVLKLAGVKTHGKPTAKAKRSVRRG